jgi:hypothetical protein
LYGDVAYVRIRVFCKGGWTAEGDSWAVDAVESAMMAAVCDEAGAALGVGTGLGLAEGETGEMGGVLLGDAPGELRSVDP